MRFPRRLPRSAFRHAVAVVALLSQLFGATGAPVFSRSPANKSGDTPFPCQNHPCGCATSEQGWAGDCCCFTLEEKLAWAEARGVTPPDHVRPAVEARKLARKSGASCCTKKTAPSCCDRADEASNEECSPEPVRVSKASVRWVAGVFAQKCRGEGAGGLLKLELISVLAPSALPAAATDPVDSVRAPGVCVMSRSACPPTPPPRLA